MNSQILMKSQVLLLSVLSLAAIHAATPGLYVSEDYEVFVDGRKRDVVKVPKPEYSPGGIWNEAEWHPYSYSVFDAKDEVEVKVKSPVFDLGKVKILPEAKDVKVISNAQDLVVFRMKPKTTLVLEPNGRHRALVIGANPPTAEVPRKDDPKVKYYAPGFYKDQHIELHDNETLYLAPCAWVEGMVTGKGRNIRICGGGVLSGAAWSWQKGPLKKGTNENSGTMVNLSGNDIDIRDITLLSSWGWTLEFNCVTNVTVDNIKIIGGRVINDDGIDICRAKDVVVRNSFVRCQDDCITPKYWCENLVVSNCVLWTDAANAFRTGYECAPRESGLVYRNLLFKDVDVLHLSLNKQKVTEYWANCAIHIQPAHGQTMYDTVYDGIRFYECGSNDVFLAVKTMPITVGSDICKTDEAGYLDGLTLRNIHLPDSQGGMIIYLSQHDAEHTIRNVRFENVTGYGKVEKIGNVDCVFNVKGK